ncbi:sugar transferase [Pseudoxanthobacter sp.]|uniref:sugar transferase n=1 Tax=Pseudoxanthobacter sp. TaxID=1925742 RepID=UPI002FE2B41C
MLKRAFDFLAALGGLIVLLPALAVLVVLIRRDSPGPAFFVQIRVGRNERPFRCYKLRSMKTGTPNRASHEVGASAITPIGAFLRRTKLDELPQLWNVLMGDMSLVGPRPCLPSQHELIAARRARGVFALRPGITGLAQIRDIDMSVPERLARVDAEYLASQSFAGDLRILLATVRGGGQGDAAHR